MFGVYIGGGAFSNLIGGTQTSGGNRISGNSSVGVLITDPGTMENMLENNNIGTTTLGTALPNVNDGVLVFNGATDNVIGGTAAGAANNILFNGRSGVTLFGVGTSGNVVEGNLLQSNAQQGVWIAAGASHNLIGGTAVNAGNTISKNSMFGILLENAGTFGNTIQGNTLSTNVFDGVLIFNGPQSTLIGGTTAAAANTIVSNSRAGVYIIGFGSTGNAVLGNFIGTNSTGQAGLGNAVAGVILDTNAFINFVGFSTAGAGNVISGNKVGVELTGAGTSSNLVQANLIGVAPNGVTALPNTTHGVLITTNASNNLVGGVTAGDGNIIANSGRDGVLVGSDSQIAGTTAAGDGNAIESNSIYSSTRLGIFLGNDVTTNPPIVLGNDALGHTGINNNYQDYPSLTSAAAVGVSTTIVGTLASPNNPGSTFRIEFFSTPTPNASAFGEGKTFLGFLTVTTNAMGNFAFTVSLPVMTIAGQYLSATATDPLGNTSEFSQSVMIT